MHTHKTQLQSIELSRLHPHPRNANVMSAGTMAKLQRHIAASGRYEPLVVRPHPRIEDAFELINGHHRREILERLGHTHADCLVWPLSDGEALMLLATINRLGGEDAAGERLELLESLHASLELSAGELAKFLPESEAVLEKLLEALPPAAPVGAPRLAEMPEAFTVFLSAGEKKELVSALKATDEDAAVALMRWARSAAAGAKGQARCGAASPE